MTASSEPLYIVISQTGTILSRLLKRITGAEYNHASVSLTEDLEQMYSFGRRNPYNPFWGGFVVESPHTGTFKRFSNTRAIVISVEINKEKRQELKRLLEDMVLHRNRYHYNYIGLGLAAFHIHWQQKNRYYCSEFVKHILSHGQVKGAQELNSIVQPMHFLDLPHTQLYCGKLSEYTALNTFIHT